MLPSTWRVAGIPGALSPPRYAKGLQNTSQMEAKGSLEGAKKRLRLRLGQKSADFSKTSLFTMFREGLPSSKTFNFR